MSRQDAVYNTRRRQDVYNTRRERVIAAHRRGQLEQLSYRQRRCLELHYGLGWGEPPRTFDEIGRCFNVTRERIRQIIRQAEGKLGL